MISGHPCHRNRHSLQNSSKFRASFSLVPPSRMRTRTHTPNIHLLEAYLNSLTNCTYCCTNSSVFFYKLKQYIHEHKYTLEIMKSEAFYK